MTDLPSITSHQRNRLAALLQQPAPQPPLTPPTPRLPPGTDPDEVEPETPPEIIDPVFPGENEPVRDPQPQTAMQ